MPETPEMPEELPLAEVTAVLAEAAVLPREGETPESAETARGPETAKEHEAMIEVHPPHEAVHSWKDVLIHIAIIVVGLLIALGLDEAAQVIHHEHEARHTRELLTEEMAANGRVEQDAKYMLAMHEDYLFNDVAVLERLRRHALAADDRIVLFHPYSLLDDTAWRTAQQSGVVAFFTYDEIHRYADLYGLQSELNSTMSDNMTALQNAQTMFYRSTADRFDDSRAAPGAAYYGRRGDAAAHAAFEGEAPGGDKLLRLTPAQVDRLEQTIQEGIYQDEKMINRCIRIAAVYKRMGL